MRFPAALALLTLVGCHGHHGDDTGPVYETGWFTDTDTDDTDVVCGDTVTSTKPVSGATDWYWRDPMHVATATPSADAYRATLYDKDGVEVLTTLAWSEDGTGFDVVPSAPLRPSSTYLLDVVDCVGETTVPFATSSYGQPLSSGAGALSGDTYVVDLSRATWVQPKGFGTILALYFTTPILLGVEWSDSQTLDLLGAQGYVTGSGSIAQNPYTATWDYPPTDFTSSPYFAVKADQTTIDVSGSDIEIYDFALDATFSPDGKSFGGGRVTGLGDTRNLGPLLNQGDAPDAVCKLAATMGVACEACPDALPYCLSLEATGVSGTLVSGLTLKRVTP